MIFITEVNPYLNLIVKQNTKIKKTTDFLKFNCRILKTS